MNTKFLLLAPLALGMLGGCTREGKFQPIDMWNGARLRPYEGLAFFPNNSEAQVPPAGTVARSENRTNEPLYYGTQNGQLITYNPLLVGKSGEDKLAVIQRGQERYQIYCQPCHGLGGYGDGLIVKRGLSAPPSYHLERLRNAADGHFYDVIANGYGSMYSYGGRVPTQDRWAIVAYIRALQLSQRAPANSVPAGQKLTPRQVVPPIDNSEKYIGGDGGAYSGSGSGNNSNNGYSPQDDIHLKEPIGSDGSTPTAQLGQPPRAPMSPARGSTSSPEQARPAKGSTLLPPSVAQHERKATVTSPAVPPQGR